MAGSIQDRGNGKYFLTVSSGFKADGKRNRKTRTVKAKSYRDAEKKLAAFITEVEAGEYIAPSHIKFGDYVKVWRKDAKKKVSPKTIETYDYVLNARILPALAHHKMEAISHVHLNDFLEETKNAGLSSSTMQKHYNVLNSIFKLAVKNETLKKNPMDKVDKPTVRYKQGQVYDSEELKQLFRLLEKEENKQMVLMVKTALKTGMRKSEMLALQWQDVDFTTNTIHVKHSLSYTKDNGYQLKEPKTKGSVRKVAPPKRLMHEIKEHIFKKKTERMEAAEVWEGGKYQFVFSTDLGKPLHQNTPNRWWSRFLKRTGFKKIRFHDLRHVAATDLINKGANIHSISKRLGHASLSTTTNIYGHYLEEADQKIADMLDEDYF